MLLVDFYSWSLEILQPSTCLKRGRSEGESKKKQQQQQQDWAALTDDDQ